MEINNFSTIKRLDWVDIAKGIGILLVIIGHTVNREIIKGAIFSFHMPLFFILSGVTFRPSECYLEFYNRFIKGFLKLILLAICLFVTRTVILIMIGFVDKVSLTSLFRSIFYFSGSDYDIADTHVVAVGMVWFLMVLFVSKEMYDIIKLKSNDMFLIGYTILGMIGGVFAGIRTIMPFSIDLSFAVMVFILIGRFIRKSKLYKFSFEKLIFFLLIWISTFLGVFFTKHDYLQFAIRHYPLFPLCYICAIFGSLVIILISFKLQGYKMPIIEKIRKWGEHSLLLFGIHYMDRIWNFWRYVPGFRGSQILSCIFRVGIDLIIFEIIDMLFCKNSKICK